MKSFAAAAAVAFAVLVLAECFPQQQAPSSSAGKGSFGATYDEVVVATQLAVRPKAASAGLNLRTGRAKAVFFRPNATAGAEIRHVKPLTATASTTTTTTTSSDGIAFAARVVGVENPLATAAAAAGRTRRTASEKPDGRSSSSSYSFQSSSFSSGSSGPQGGTTVVGVGLLPAAAAPAAAPAGTSSFSKGSSHSWSQLLSNGQTVSVSESEDSQVVGGKAPTSNKLVTVFVSGGR